MEPQNNNATILSPITRGEMIGWTVCCVAFGSWLGAIAHEQTWSMAADPYAVVFPSARELLNGKWLDALAPLHRGQARMPFYSIFVALVGWWTTSLQTAAQIVNVLAWSGALFCTGIGLMWIGWRRAVPFVVIGLLANHTVGRAVGDALPAGLYAFFVAAAFLVLLRALSGSSPLQFFGVGLLAAAVVQTRFNGIGVIGIPVAVGLLWKGPRLKAVAFFAVGLIVGLIPLYIISAYLEHSGVSYPNFYIKSSNLAGRADVGFWSVIWSGIMGVVRLPLRLFSTGIPVWVFLAGMASTVISVVRHKQKVVFRPWLLSFFMLVGALLPIHHENRYQVPFVGIWWALAGVFTIAVLERIASRLRISGRWVPAVAIPVALLTLPSGLRAVLDQRSVRIMHSHEVTQLCHDLADIGAGAPIRLGVPPNKFQYHWLRGCELALDLPVVILPAHRDASGPDLAMEYEVDPTTSVVPIPAAMQQVAIRIHDKPLKGEDVPSDIWDSKAIKVQLPHGVRHRCCKDLRLEHTEAQPLILVAQTPTTNALKLTIRSQDNSDAPLRYVVSTNQRIERFRLLENVAGPISARYCPANPIRADGEIRFLLQ